MADADALACVMHPMSDAWVGLEPAQRRSTKVLRCFPYSSRIRRKHHHPPLRVLRAHGPASPDEEDLIQPQKERGDDVGTFESGSTSSDRSMPSTSIMNARRVLQRAKQGGYSACRLRRSAASASTVPSSILVEK
jgi:hypothetical protein